MDLDPFTPHEREIINRRRNRPSAERFQDLVDRGIIDRQGRVLVRMPPDPFDSEPDHGAEGNNDDAPAPEAADTPH